MTKPPANGAASSRLGTAWALVIETVEARDIPPGRGFTNWEGVFEEILLRLEKTPISQALMMTFERESQATVCSGRLKAAAKKREVADQVEIFRRKLDGGGHAVYVRRSQKYKGIEPEGKRKRGKSDDDGAEVSDFD